MNEQQAEIMIKLLESIDAKLGNYPNQVKKTNVKNIKLYLDKKHGIKGNNQQGKRR